MVGRGVIVCVDQRSTYANDALRLIKSDRSKQVIYCNCEMYLAYINFAS